MTKYIVHNFAALILKFEPKMLVIWECFFWENFFRN